METRKKLQNPFGPEAFRAVEFVPSEAVFIDNVSDGSTKKRQRQLGQNGPKTAWLISSALRDMSASGKMCKRGRAPCSRYCILLVTDSQDFKIRFHPHMSVIRIEIKCISIELLGV